MHQQNKIHHKMNLKSFAESEGFKPPIPIKSIPDFESSAFDHSANFPKPTAKLNIFGIWQAMPVTFF